ncbi:hypothetical protein GR211_21960 [Rhizobium leguminosarum]|uniref:hypothetical protein n=1 Tax=Rhizobium ruizarguesonis TaxID=2081791 RepID=UPI0013B920BC|nr:hypothetical protein [Rhizobium ruizarguesonis]NEJ15485.1 hypothetical protein [Rhizobium ruizarguesonis]NEK29560.1 hypothetical protein [Rhizobium ruizarguesonis]
MELIRGCKPLTETERVFASEKLRHLKAEIELSRTMNPALLEYERGYSTGRGPNEDRGQEIQLDWKGRRIHYDEAAERHREYGREYYHRRKGS